MDKRYAKQIIEWAEEAKQILTVRKEIIMDDDVTDSELVSIIRMMYRAKVETQNETITKTKENLGL